MKYLLVCPSCGATTPVGVGQAGQTVSAFAESRSTCLRSAGCKNWRPWPDEQPAVRAWSRRQGLAFLGCAIAGLGDRREPVAFCCFGPSPVDARELFGAGRHRGDFKRSGAYSPAEGFRRFQTIEVPLPSLAESLKGGEVPVHLLPSAGLLIAFEGKGTEALAPDEAKKVMEELTKVGNKAYERQTTRNATADWLWALAAAGTFGLGLAGSTLLMRPNQRRRPAGASGTRR